jgi:hypothetical protein
MLLMMSRRGMLLMKMKEEGNVVDDDEDVDDLNDKVNAIGHISFHVENPQLIT